MILPVIALPPPCSDGLDVDTLTSRLAALAEVVLHGSGYPPAGGGSGAEVAASYKPFLRECGCRVGPFEVFSGDRDAQTDAVVAWLDSGARRAIINVDVSDPSGVEDLAAWSRQLPASRHRLVAAFRARDLTTEADGLVKALRGVMDGLKPVVGCVQIDFEGDYAVAPQILAELKALRGKEGASDYVEIIFTRDDAATSGVDDVIPWTPAEIGKLHLEFGVDVQCPAGLELPSGGGGGLGCGDDGLPAVDAVSAFLVCLRTDRPDGLMTTVVCDTTGVALGLVYSNSASIRASITSGRGIYWSRSRGGLWRKGDTSGAWQELRGVTVDCDSDALKFTVWQHGSPPAFCHFNRRNCWEVERGLGHLERTLTKRKEEAPEGSYTKRLFEDPVLLRNKLVEEAQELAEAETKKHVAEEAADVTYFMMVRCAAAGVKLEDVEKELDMRSLKLKRRAGEQGLTQDRTPEVPDGHVCLCGKVRTPESVGPMHRTCQACAALTKAAATGSSSAGGSTSAGKRKAADTGGRGDLRTSKKPASSAPSKIKSRTRLTFGQKIEILGLLKGGVAYDEIARRFKCGKTAISNIVKERVALEKDDASGERAPDSKSTRGGAFPQVDSLVLEFVESSSKHGLPVTRATIMSFGIAAKKLALEAESTAAADKTKLAAFRASKKWARNFVRRKGLINKSLRGEAGSAVDPETSDKEKGTPRRSA